MPFLVSNIRLPVEVPEARLAAEISRRLGVNAEDLVGWRIVRKSLDARSRNELKFVYNAVAEVGDETLLRKLRKQSNVAAYVPRIFDDPAPGHESLVNRPVIVGTGPAGLLAGYYLAQKGFRPILLERGAAVKKRVPAIREFDRGGAHDPENNYLFGEGGAGCFSDGKLTCRVTGPDVDWVLDRFVECGGRQSLVYENRPHLGSNKLPMICRNFRRKIEAMGGEYRFDCRMEGLIVEEGRITGLKTSDGTLQTECVILAIGHSARDTYQRLHEAGVAMERKAFQLGLRIEQPQEQVNRHKYGKRDYGEILGAADYTLVAHGNRDLYTFCMCAGGYVIPSISEPGMFCTNGMSNSRHDSPFANSGLMVTLEPDEFGSSHPLAGVELQRRYESLAYEKGDRNYLAPVSRVDDFLKGRPPQEGSVPSSYERGMKLADLSELLPAQVIAAIREGMTLMDQRWKGDFLKNAVLAGPEMRGSAPVRMARDKVTRESPSTAGLYPVGEGAGYAGGIVTAAIDGLRSARAIIRRYAPLESSPTVL